MTKQFLDYKIKNDEQLRREWKVYQLTHPGISFNSYCKTQYRNHECRGIKEAI